MPAINLYITLAIALSFILVGILLIPNVKKARKRQRPRSLRHAEGDHKDWKAVSLRLEKYIKALRKKIALMERRDKKAQKELYIEKQKYEKLQEKIDQERGWKIKESGEIQKKTELLMKTKKDLERVEHNLAEEHGMRLRLERELKESQDEATSLAEGKRALEIEITKARTQIESYNKEAQTLRELNAKLTKKQEDTAWVAKTEYVRLENLYKAAQEELDKYKQGEEG